jgi:hypothetical protein
MHYAPDTRIRSTMTAPDVGPDGWERYIRAGHSGTILGWDATGYVIAWDAGLTTRWTFAEVERDTEPCDTVKPLVRPTLGRGLTPKDIILPAMTWSFAPR